MGETCIVTLTRDDNEDVRIDGFVMGKEEKAGHLIGRK